MTKRKDECLFCSRRSCRTRIVRFEEPRYDELACTEHVSALEKHADAALGGRGRNVDRWHCSTTGRYVRGEAPTKAQLEAQDQRARDALSIVEKTFA